MRRAKAEIAALLVNRAEVMDTVVLVAEAHHVGYTGNKLVAELWRVVDDNMDMVANSYWIDVRVWLYDIRDTDESPAVHDWFVVSSDYFLVGIMNRATGESDSTYVLRSGRHVRATWVARWVLDEIVADPWRPLWLRTVEMRREEYGDIPPVKITILDLPRGERRLRLAAPLMWKGSCYTRMGVRDLGREFRLGVGEALGLSWEMSGSMLDVLCRLLGRLVMPRHFEYRISVPKRWMTVLKQGFDERDVLNAL